MITRCWNEFGITVVCSSVTIQLMEYGTVSWPGTAAALTLTNTFQKKAGYCVFSFHHILF